MAKDLATDPFIIRARYAKAAIAQGVRMGIDEHGDDFVFGASQVPEEQGAGAGFDSDDPALTDWYIDARTGPIDSVTSEDVRRTLEPGRIQPPGKNLPDRAASGEASMTVGERVEGPLDKGDTEAPDPAEK